MIKFVINLSIACFIANTGLAQATGKLFPSISGETMTNKIIKIPVDTKGKYTVIGLAYSKEAEGALKSWLSPAYNTFINSTRAFDYDINLFFLPFFTGANQALTNTAKKKVKTETDKELHPYILFIEDNIKTYKEELSLEEKDIPYFFVLDKNGLIVYATSGSYSEKKMEEIEDILE